MNEFQNMQNVFPWLRLLDPVVRANGVEEYIQGLFGSQPDTNSGQTTEQNAQGAPPASAKAIRQLPTICVTTEDLVDENNRECCICLETYELQTDNPLYEAGRVERMKTRKPRFAMYELKRMSVPELLALKRRPVPGMVDKDDLINFLVRDEQIEIIPSPEPVEYDLDTLKGMKVSELKRTMADAGVFFHAKDVVEKSDMLTIFLNSGRLSLCTPQNKPAVVSTDNPSQPSIPSNDPNWHRSSSSVKRPFVETVDEDSDSEPVLKKPEIGYSSTPIEMFGSNSSSSLGGHGTPNDVENMTHADDFVRTNAGQEDDVSVPENGSTTGGESNPVGGQSPFPDIDGDESISERRCHISGTNLESDSYYQCLPLGDQDTTPPRATAYVAHNACPFEEYPVSHLRDLARINSVDVSSCFERSDIVRLLTNARVEMKHPSEVLRDSLSNFSLSELRILAAEVKVNISHCSDKEEMLSRMVQEAAVERPYLQKYLRALCPLSKLSLGQLRKTARDSGVNINDCLERGEILQRLIASRRVARRS
ncbi:MAG: hypothetical protein SGBAC_000141 [Bacillariaceae sp.]